MQNIVNDNTLIPKDNTPNLINPDIKDSNPNIDNNNLKLINLKKIFKIIDIDISTLEDIKNIEIERNVLLNENMWWSKIWSGSMMISHCLRSGSLLF